MGKIYGKLFSIFLLSLISMSFHVSAFSTGAGTCNIDSQDIEGGHGPSALKSPAGFTVTTAMKSPGAFEFTVNGPGSGFEGILLYVIDGTGNRLGKFVSLPSNIQIKQDCNPAGTTVTHTSKAMKKYPFTLSWNAPQGTNGNLTVKALVVKDSQPDFARLDPVQFDPVSGASSALTGSTPPPSNNQPDTTTESDNFLKKYSLFLVMVGITTLLYVVGSITESMLKRQQVKSRSFAKTINNGFENSR